MPKKALFIVLAALLVATLACANVDDLAEEQESGAVQEPQQNVLFEDDFSSDSSGWEIGDYEGGTVGYGSGVYVVTSTEQGAAMWGLAGRNYVDVDITVEATQVSAPENDNNGYGVGCRIQDDDDGYYLRVSGDGYYSIAKAVEGEFEYLIDWDTSNAINQGNATNTLRIVCSGTQLTLYVNGREVGSTTDDQYAAGDITLTATTFEAASTEVHFDNLVIVAP